MLEGKLTLFLIADVILLVAAIAVAVLGPRTGNRTLDESSLGADVGTRVDNGHDTETL